MRTITRTLLASVLAIGAAAFAGCGDTDCPATVQPHTSCSSGGLICYYEGVGDCACNDGMWQCAAPDMAIPADMSKPRDLAPESD